MLDTTGELGIKEENVKREDDTRMLMEQKNWKLKKES